MPYAHLDGFDMYYETYGEGEPVVFIHGVGVTSKVWEFQKEAFSKRYRMIIYDLRGSGKSGKTPEVQHTADLLAKDLLALVNNLELKRFHLVGISLGAAIAMKFAIEYPERVKSLVLSGAFIDFKRVLSFISKYFSNVIGKMLMKRFFGELATKIMLPSAPRKELLYYHRQIIRIDKDEVLKYRQLLNSYSITSALDKINAPVLITYGEYEFPLHKYGRMIKEKVKNARMMVIPGVGHGWNGEDPGLFNSIVLDFITEHDQ